MLDGSGHSAPIGLYIHIPFCAHKCPYCDFNTFAGLEANHAATVEALCGEMAHRRAFMADRHIHSVFIGGGTPTVLAAGQLERLFDGIREHFCLEDGVEITCEANPGTVDREKFALLRQLGVNRLSLGVQSFQPSELRFLGRIHDVQDVCQAYDAARAAGLENINLDLMFGLPAQTESAWRDSLTSALALAPEHLSLYSLIVEPDTPLNRWVQTGKVQAPDDDEAAVLYEMALERLDAAGYVHYEISNWAVGGSAAMPEKGTSAPTDSAGASSRVCQHNLIYWRNQEYLGLGPGAHSHLISADTAGPCRERRWGNHKSVLDYLRRMRQGEALEAFEEVIDPRLSMGETMMLGLRLVQEGVQRALFWQRYGLELVEVFADELARLQDWQLVEVDAMGVRLTRAGLMVGNQVFAEFLP